MKIPLTLVLLFFGISSNTPCFAQNYGFTHVENLKKDGYTLQFIAAQDDKDHWKMGKFRFRFEGNKPIKLWGFGFEKNGDFRTRFENYSRFRDGKWSEVPVDYCGTGAQTFILEAGRDYTFLVSLWPYQKGGEKGVIKLDGETVSLTSSPFDTTQLRNNR